MTDLPSAAVPERGTWFDSFTRPVDLDIESWAAFKSHVDRMQDARARRDLPLAVGCAKETCESLARVVLLARGESYPSNGDYGGLISAAHKAIGQHPGDDLAGDEQSRKMAQSVMRLAGSVGQLRNDFGTGHGSARPPETTIDHAELGCDSAEVWCRWMVRRLPRFLHGDVNAMVGRLRAGLWHRYELANRLSAVDWDNTPPEDQRRLGIAVGHRALQLTFLVQGEGVDAVYERPERFANEYRLGVVSGLLFSVDGTLTTNLSGVENAAKMIAVCDDPDAAVAILTGQIDRSRWQPPEFGTPPTLEEVVAAAHSHAHMIGGTAGESWRRAWSLIDDLWIKGHPF